jgi:two-component sensor histidine kinase
MHGDDAAPHRAGEWSWPLGPALAHAALEKAPAIIYIYDVKAEKGVFQNRRFAELLGQPLDGGNDWRRYIHPDDAAGFPEHRVRLKSIRPEETLTWTYRMQAADGDWRHFISRDVLLDADGDGAPRLVVGTASEISEQKAIEERKNLLIGEMRHRVRNLVAMIDAIGRQSLPKDQPPVKAFFDAFMGRVRALLEAGEMVSLSEHRTADLRTIADAALGPFLAGTAPRVAVDGPHVFVPENAAGGLALAFYELATNAAKYGALSRDEGSVMLSWAVAPAGEKRTVTVEWRERGGPPVTLPIREGFGSRVIRNAMGDRGAAVDLAFRPEGVECRIVFPVPHP